SFCFSFGSAFCVYYVFFIYKWLSFFQSLLCTLVILRPLQTCISGPTFAEATGNPDCITKWVNFLFF
ncbi:hypothetical protein BGX38DRAFT_1206180, partial [Terfezia claveryi]